MIVKEHAGGRSQKTSPWQSRLRSTSVESVTIMKSSATSTTGYSPSFDFNIMDVEDALQRLGHDEELFRDIVLIYTEDSPGMLKAIHEAVDHADTPALQRAAHSLKGLTATLSAREAASAAYRLEQMGATGNLQEAAGALAELDRRVAELDQAVAEYLQHHR